MPFHFEIVTEIFIHKTTHTQFSYSNCWQFIGCRYGKYTELNNAQKLTTHLKCRRWIMSVGVFWWFFFFFWNWETKVLTALQANHLKNFFTQSILLPKHLQNPLTKWKRMIILLISTCIFQMTLSCLPVWICPIQVSSSTEWYTKNCATSTVLISSYLPGEAYILCDTTFR